MRKLFVIFALMVFSANAQVATQLQINRFDPTVSNAVDVQIQSFKQTATMIASTTDTTAWHEFNSKNPQDTLLSGCVVPLALTEGTDSVRASVKYQYAVKGVILSTGIMDSVSYIPTGPLGTMGKSKALWFSRPPAATQVRAIVAFASTGTSGSQNVATRKSYCVVLTYRPGGN